MDHKSLLEILEWIISDEQKWHTHTHKKYSLRSFTILGRNGKSLLWYLAKTVGNSCSDNILLSRPPPFSSLYRIAVENKLAPWCANLKMMRLFLFFPPLLYFFNLPANGKALKTQLNRLNIYYIIAEWMWGAFSLLLVFSLTKKSNNRLQPVLTGRFHLHVTSRK